MSGGLRFNSIVKLASDKRFAEFVQTGSTFPINVEISPCGHCNANCPDCLYAEKKYSGTIDKFLLLNALAEMEFVGVSAITWSGCGEPTIHPNFAEFIRCGSIMHQGIFTNALAHPEYDPSLVDWIRVTVVPGRDIPVDHLRILRKCKTLGLCVRVANGDTSEIMRALNAGHDAGVDYVHVRPVLKIGGETPKAHKPEIDDSLLIYDVDKFGANYERGYSCCRGYHFSPFVWQDGAVSVCAYMREHAGYVLGNLNDTSFSQIVRSFPKSMPVLPDCMVCCKNHEINGLLDAALNVPDRMFV